jgi:hypothetical protein
LAHEIALAGIDPSTIGHGNTPCSMARSLTPDMDFLIFLDTVEYISFELLSNNSI